MPTSGLKRRIRASFRSISTRLVISFITLVLLSAAAIGVPAIFLLQNQMDEQAWSLVDQGVEFSRTLFNDEQEQLITLALLTSQRPTLNQLVRAGDPSRLTEYLEELRSGADLDLLVLCSANGTLVDQVGVSISEDICASLGPGIYIDSSSGETRILLAAQALLTDSSAGRLTVITGELVDQEFLRNIADQTGFVQTLLLDGKLAVTSLEPSHGQGITENSIPGSTNSARSRVSIDGSPYFSIRMGLHDEPPLDLLISLPLADIAAARQALTRNIAAGIALVVFLGSGMGILLAQAINRPLKQLASAAVELEKGNLSHPVALNTRLREVAQVGYALDEARLSLQSTLKELGDEKAWIDNLLESIVEGILTLDKNGRITYFSAGAERITGWKFDRALSRSCDEIFRCVEPGARFSEQLPAPGRQQKIQVLTAAGQPVTLAVTGAALAPPRAGRARVALVLRDASDEEAIRRLLGDFLANMTHEFRTPLAALAASIELLIDQFPDLSMKEQEELLDSTRLGILGLQTLIDNLLEGASIEAGRFRVRPTAVDLQTIILETIRTIQPLAQKYHQLLLLDLPDALPTVSADERRTIQVLTNLLSNAIKYNPPDAAIRISVECKEQELEVRVEDDGPGIPPGERDDLFQRFARRGSENAKSGAGLGLSVVKAIVEAQGGRVGMRDADGKGSVFWFTLPLVQPVSRVETPQQEGPSSR